MKKLILIFLISTTVHAQKNRVIDSLEIEISKKQTDISLIENYYFLAREYQKFNVEMSTEINAKIWQLTRKNNYTKGYAHYFLIQSLNCFNIEKYNLSKKYAQKSQTFYLKIGDKAGYLNAVIEESTSCYLLREINESIKIAKAGISFAKSNFLKPQVAKLNYSLSLNYYYINDLNKSLYYIKIAINYFRQLKSNDNIHLINCYTQIASLYIATNQLPLALDYMEMGIDLVNTTDEINAVTGYYSTLGWLYIEMKDYDKALKYVNLCIDKAKFLRNTELLAYNINSLAIINLKQKKYNLAIVNAKKVLDLSVYDDEKILSNQILGNCYFANKDLKKALGYQNKVVYYIKNFKDKNIDQGVYKTIYEEIAKTENELGNFKNAYKFSLINKFINDSLASEEKINRINELQTKFEVSEKENALKKSITEKQKKDIEIEKQNSKILIISIVLVFITLISFILVRIYLLIKEKNKRLANTNQIIENKNELLFQSKKELEKLVNDKDILLKEVHHRVKNNLQLVISLLNIQSRETKHEIIDKFINTSLNRITSMSLVHQNLYLSENVGKVSFNEYLHNLTNSISSSFQDTKDRITVIINCNNILLNIETAIPLGLIINELIHNIYKYAFPNSLEGKISIKIKEKDNKYKLSISDNGIGFKEKFENDNSIGLKLVNLLSQQINGDFEKISSDKTKFIINFKENF